MIDIDITGTELQLAAGILRRGGPEFTAWLYSMPSMDAYVLGRVHEAIVKRAIELQGIVSPESGPSSKTH